MPDRYFLKIDDDEEFEVTEATFVSAERAAGFNNTLGQPDKPATAGFSNGPIRGRTERAKALTPPSTPAIRREWDSVLTPYVHEPKLGCSLVAHRRLGLCAGCAPEHVERIGWQLLALDAEEADTTDWLLKLERFYRAVRKIAYAGDCEACGVPGDLLHLCDALEGEPS